MNRLKIYHHIFFVLALLVFSYPTPTRAQIFGSMRDSTFWKSCRNYKMDHRELTAECLGKDQQYYPASILLLGIQNDDGDLEGGFAFKLDGSLNISTYHKSCTDIKVDEVLGYILTANCRRKDGSMNAAKLELKGIENHDGVLRYIGTDEERDANLAPISDKPVAAGEEKGDAEFCKSYAQAAEDAQTANEADHCGFSGGRWMHNYQAHFDWCMQQTVSAAEAENNTRIADHAKCTSTKAAAAGENPPGMTACLFFDPNFLGVAKCMTAIGRFNVKAERANQYSSARVTPGFRMVIYDGRDQTGTRCGYLTGEVPQITPRCDNKTESIEIEKAD
jgi:CVNH domain